MQWSRKKIVLTASLLVLLVSVVGGLLLSRSSDDVDVNLNDPGVTSTPGIGTNANAAGKSFPFGEVTDIATNRTVTLSNQQKPLVVNFWFSTCEPCKREMPALQQGSQNYAETVSFLGINPNDTVSGALQFLEEYGVTFPNYLDDGDLLSKAGIVNMPTTMFVDSNGKIVKTHTGEITTAQLADIIQDAFGIKQ